MPGETVPRKDFGSDLNFILPLSYSGLCPLLSLQMEAELERFHKQNTQLELNITELWQKLRATDQEMRRERQKVRCFPPSSRVGSWLP